MKRYEPNTPRVGFALAAVAITTITFGLFVVVPMDVESPGMASGTTAAAQAVTPVVSAAVDHA